MRGRVLVRSASAGTRIARAERWLQDLGAASECVIVAAQMEAATKLARAKSYALASSFGWHRFTLAKLAAALAGPALARAGLMPAGSLALEAVCARIVHDRAPKLGRLAAVADRPGLPRALARTLEELRGAGTSPGRVPDADVVELMLAYDRELLAQRLADRATVLCVATDVVRSGAKDDRIGLPLLLLDVEVRSAVERDFVKALAEAATQLLVTVPAGDERTERALASLALDVVDDEPPRTTSALARLQSGVFSAEAAAEASEPSEEVSVFSAPGEARECVEIARRIRKEAERGVGFDRMAVLLRAPAQYRAHLEEALARAEVPAYFARGTRTPNPAGRAFVALLACALDGLSATRFAEYLSLGVVPDATSEGRPPPAAPATERWVPPDDELIPDAVAVAGAGPGAGADADADAIAAAEELMPVAHGNLRAPRLWEKLLVDAAVIGGRERWIKRLDGLHAELARVMAELDDPQGGEGERVLRETRALEALRDYALPLLEELEPLARLSATWREWIDRLGALATRALKRPECVLATLAELEPMANVGPVDLPEVRLVLERRLTDATLPPSGRPYGAVYVASTDEARGMAFDVVFVPGLAERVFPQKVIEDPIVPDAVRAKIDERLTRNAERGALERLALRLAVGAATSRVVVSYPRLDTSGARPRTPSFYALEVLRAAEGRLPGFDELARRANVGGDARIGWPAPSSARDAIDEAEHDLALLERVLHRPESEAIGTARYLLKVNKHLERALRFRAQRWTRAWYPADGVVDPAPAARAALQAHALASRSFSPTALQNFALCPYRFLLQAVHRLSPREEPVALEELDPLQRGSLMHETQFALYLELHRAGMLPVTPDNLDRARAMLDEVMKREAEKARDELAPAIPRVWDAAVADVTSDLREWLRRMADGDESRWTPVYFELAFGLTDRSARDPRSSKSAVPLDCGVKLRGSIDVVEQRDDGALRATDHKSGKIRATAGRTVIEGGKILQPVLYALAIEKMFPGTRVEEGRLYYCTAAGDYKTVPVPLDQRARDAADAVAKTIGRAIEEAFLPAAPSEGACEYCDYRDVCGPHEEQRTARKRRDRLLALDELRRQP